jgi:hypothetical protein
LPEQGICDYYILFPSHHEGLRLHQELKAAGVKCVIAPTPRSASSFCGMSLRLAEDELPAARQVIAACGANIDRIARIQRPPVRYRGA